MFHFDFLLSINFLYFSPPPRALIFLSTPHVHLQYEEKAPGYFRQMDIRERDSSPITYRLILCIDHIYMIACAG